MNEKLSNSVGHGVGLTAWLRESFALLRMRMKEVGGDELRFEQLFEDIDAYCTVFSELEGSQLQAARILEIGYGARPNRLLALVSMGFNAFGIDLDRPVLRGELAEFLDIHRKNGTKRALKSLVRHVFFDRLERNALDVALRARGAQLQIKPERFLVGDAGDFDFGDRSIDFVYSEDVFEHVPLDSLHRLCRNLSHAMSQRAVALISPVVFSGIAGGHLVEWYPHTLLAQTSRTTAPWEHLRQRRAHADCYLNEMRVGEFEALFREYFEVVDVVSRDAGIGRDHLTPEIRAELPSFTDAELLSHKWTFVLRSKTRLTT